MSREVKGTVTAIHTERGLVTATVTVSPEVAKALRDNMPVAVTITIPEGSQP